jgi:transposase-like protein
MKGTLPTTLKEAIVYFSDMDVATGFVRDIRWPKGVECPTCGSKQVSYLSTRRVWKCKNKHPRRQFTVKVGTIFEDSPLGLDKWLPAVWLVTNCKNGISSYELSKDLGVTQKSAWFMLHRVRLAMQSQSFEKMSGEIEADETYVGGKVANMHRRSKRKIKAVNEGNWGKSIVLGLLHRETGEVRAKVAPSRRKHPIHENITANVNPGAILYTDIHHGYDDLPAEILRQAVNHLSSYVEGRVHVNGLENFWSLLKRTLGGTYVSVDPMHLFRYLDEQCFRYNRRYLTDAERFALVIGQVIGRRITYAQLTGKIETETVQA